MTKLCGVYLLTHVESGRKYVGQSVDIRARWRAHSRTTEDSYIGRAIRKYGFEAFAKSILELCDPAELNEKEAAHINALATIYPNGFNLRNGGGQIGTHHPESRRKMSLARKGQPKSEEHRERIGNAHRGRPQSAEFVARRTGKPLSAATKEKISLAAAGRTVSAETKLKLAQRAQCRNISAETRQKMAESNRGQKRTGAALEAISEANKRRTPEEKAASAAKQVATKAAKKLLRQNAAIAAAGDLLTKQINRQHVGLNV